LTKVISFCEENNLENKFIRPIIITVLQGITSLGSFYNNKCFNVESLNNIYKEWKNTKEDVNNNDGSSLDISSISEFSAESEDENDEDSTLNKTF
jgi:hypothetical protein